MHDHCLEELLHLFPELDRTEAAIGLARFRGLLRVTLGEAVARLRAGEDDASVNRVITTVITGFDGHAYARSFAELHATCEVFGIPTAEIVGFWTTPN